MSSEFAASKPASALTAFAASEIDFSNRSFCAAMYLREKRRGACRRGGVRASCAGAARAFAHTPPLPLVSRRAARGARRRRDALRELVDVLRKLDRLAAVVRHELVLLLDRLLPHLRRGARAVHHLLALDLHLLEVLLELLGDVVGRHALAPVRVNLRLQVAVVVLALRLAHEDLVEPVLEVRDELLLVDLRLLRRVGAVRALVRRVGGEAVQVEHLDRPRLVLQPELLDLVVRLPDRLLEVVDALLLHHHLPREEIALHLQLGEHLVHLRRGGDIRHPPRARSALERVDTAAAALSLSHARGRELLPQRRWSYGQ